jgi:hypothetical protein
MDSYYLSDVTSVATAQALARIGAAMVTLTPQLNGKPLSAAGREQALVLGAMLKESDLDRISGDIDTALKENGKSARGPSPTLKANLVPAVARYQTEAKALADLLGAMSQGKVVGREDFQRTAARADQATYDLWEKAISELDTVLGQRIGGFGTYRWHLILGTLLALALAVWICQANCRLIFLKEATRLAHWPAR